MLFELVNKKFEIIFLVLLIVVLVFSFFVISPLSFPKESTIRIEKGMGLSEVAALLKEKKVVRSAFWLKFFVIAQGGAKGVHQGDYYMRSRETTLDLARRLVNADYELDSLRVTIPEGYSNIQIAELLSERFSFFDASSFIEAAPEGYLFPDTYFFLPNATSEDVIKVMRANFDNKINEIQYLFDSSELNFNEVIILASIIEEEAVHEDDRKIVSGILQTRLEIGMPLQVDATFSYVNGKSTYELTHDDLQEDSPYNTYTNTGLPPTPISNPGIESILAALNPEKTNYLYFLSDLSGNIYYAENFEGHQTNREKYLRK